MCFRLKCSSAIENQYLLEIGNRLPKYVMLMSFLIKGVLTKELGLLDWFYATWLPPFSQIYRVFLKIKNLQSEFLPKIKNNPIQQQSDSYTAS